MADAQCCPMQKPPLSFRPNNKLYFYSKKDKNTELFYVYLQLMVSTNN